MKSKIATAFTFICFLLLIISNQSEAQVKLPQIVRDSMILQRDAPVNIWGWSVVNEKVDK